MHAEIIWTCVPFGEAALLVEANVELDAANRAVLSLAAALDAASIPGVTLVLPALNSLLLRFDPLETSHTDLEYQVRPLLGAQVTVDAAPSRIVNIPVRYGGEDGPDLQDVAQQLGLSAEDVIRLHCRQLYRVLMIGFAPGFPYIGGLPAELMLARRATPRAAVPAGSVAIAAGMTGIYPQRLPGGWHVIGKTDRVLFDPTRSPPSLLQAGDRVQFVNADD